MNRYTLTADVYSPSLPIHPDCSNAVSLSSIPSDTVLFVILSLFLVLFNATVIAGNSLVISAIVTDQRLRSVTNTFVASLAVADLMLGVTVLPFSSANQVLRYWPFGEAWCSVWLAVDVWLSTSSILNLCAISLDRYLAIGYSFRYQRLMSPQRARLLVAAVWVAAFVICFPPLLGWRRSKPPIAQVNRTFEGVSPSAADGVHGPPVFLRFEEATSGYSISHHTICDEEEEEGSSTEDQTLSSGDPPQCQLNSDAGYVIYSACGSFWIPMCVMVFFYWRIYVTASRNSRSLRRGFVLVQSLDARGVPGGHDRGGTGAFNTESMALRVHRGGGGGCRNAAAGRLESKTVSCRSVPSRPTERSDVALRRRSLDSGIQSSLAGDHSRSSSCRRKQLSSSKSTDAEHCVQSEHPKRSDPKRAVKLGLSSSLFRADGFHASSQSRTLHRLNKEKKAAKTIGVIVGCFIACWAPFFTVYLLGAFCDRCTADRVFVVFFWLGYFNSAINPFVYALCSRDFRTAFKKLLRCRGTYASHEGPRRRKRAFHKAVPRRLNSKIC